jgi:hypothetical protein
MTALGSVAASLLCITCLLQPVIAKAGLSTTPDENQARKQVSIGKSLFDSDDVQTSIKFLSKCFEHSGVDRDNCIARVQPRKECTVSPVRCSHALELRFSGLIDQYLGELSKKRPQLKASFISDQSQWIKYIDVHCALEADFYGQMRVSMRSTVFAACREEAFKDRAGDLRDLVYDLTQ